MNIMRKLLLLLSLVAFVACEKPDDGYIWNDNWSEEENQEPEDNPQEPDKEDPKPETKEGKDRLVWIDAAAESEDYANSEKNIAADMKRLKETGFTGVIVEVRPTTAGLLFKSDFDYLQAFIDAGKAEGLDVYAAINTMVGGKQCPYGLGSSGPLFDGSAKKEWASVINTADGLVNCMDMAEGTKFLNPANDEVVDYLLGILEDLAAYDVKGIILDRCRYDDFELQSDFSEVSRKKFEDYIGKKVDNWPSDVFAPGANKLSSPVTQMQVKWMEFRAKNIHDFMEKASARVHSVNPDVHFGAYVGAWYSSYYYSGVNWASPRYNAKSAYSWATSAYSSYGYADHCDIMIIGAYAVPYIGGPDIGNSTGFENGGQGSLMPKIVDACINNSTGGMFFFDLCHIKMYDYWNDIKKAFDQYIETL